MPKTPKIFSEFTLLPEGTRVLQEFFDQNFDALRKKNPEAQAKLQALLRNDILPRDEDLVASLKHIFSGKCEYALVIHGFPERKGLETRTIAPDVDDMYTSYISDALLRMHAIPLPGNWVFKGVLYRKRDSNPKTFPGLEAHRDALDKRFLNFSVAYNGEQAPVEVIGLAGALSSLPKSKRNIPVTVETFRAEDESKSLTGCTLGELDRLLRTEKPEDGEFISIVSPAKPKWASKFESAISGHCQKVTLKPGDILFLDEAHIFHRAHAGDVTLVPPEAHFTRLLRFSSAGAPMER